MAGTYIKTHTCRGSRVIFQFPGEWMKNVSRILLEMELRCTCQPLAHLSLISANVTGVHPLQGPQAILAGQLSPQESSEEGSGLVSPAERCRRWGTIWAGCLAEDSHSLRCNHSPFTGWKRGCVVRVAHKTLAPQGEPLQGCRRKTRSSTDPSPRKLRTFHGTEAHFPLWQAGCPPIQQPLLHFFPANRTLLPWVAICPATGNES